MSFHLTVRHRFPGALQQREYVSMTSAALQRAGFTAENSLVALCSCRDEITRSLQRLIEGIWGPTFDLSGLAGMFSTGSFGLQAALHHRPQLGGRSNFVLYAMTHVGIDDDGTIGAFRRDRITAPVPTCGSLDAVTQAFRSGQARVTLDPDDLEQSRIEQRLASRINDDDQRDVADMAELALACTERDIGRALDALIRDRGGRPLGVDGALLTGIQIHGPYDRHYIWPSIAVIEIDGEVLPALPNADELAG